jgi:hypothetical protein
MVHLIRESCVSGITQRPAVNSMGADFFDHPHGAALIKLKAEAQM